MTAMEALEKLLPSYVRYYNIKREDVTPPFSAEAEFYTHDEAYFLFKEAKMSESESREFVFFATTEHLDANTLKNMMRQHGTPVCPGWNCQRFIIQQMWYLLF